MDLSSSGFRGSFSLFGAEVKRDGEVLPSQSSQSSQLSQRERPSGQPRASPLSYLIDGTGGHVALCTQAVQPLTHISVWSVFHQYREVHTPPRHTSAGLFRARNIPLAASHRRAQLLLISRVTRRSRWASALGGTATDVLEGEGRAAIA